MNNIFCTSGSLENSNCLWNVRTKQQKPKFDSQMILFGCYATILMVLNKNLAVDNSTRFWVIKTGQQKTKLDGHEYTNHSICFFPAETILIKGQISVQTKISQFLGSLKYKL
ncbi:unnamed protein product [Paramecium sonneborni]|uniref:Uncharacterized protein n=1 Tax=Paramecium sonneborni TaxID=65129 RepID=A0A8S1RQP8_9CILI|nr:unnamed protein product [Paramecium sonneborni]